jgi:hypothetical protein
MHADFALPHHVVRGIELRPHTCCSFSVVVHLGIFPCAFLLLFPCWAIWLCPARAFSFLGTVLVLSLHE